MHKSLTAMTVAAAAAITACTTTTTSDTARLEVEDYEAMHRARVTQSRIASAPAEKPTVYADRNNDGRVTREEAKVSSALTRQFDQVDTNDDGALDRAEFARLEAASAEARAPDPAPAPILVQTDHPALDMEPDPRPREEYARPRG